MSTLAQIEAVVPSLKPEELDQLEQTIQQARVHRAENPAISAFDLPPLDLGPMLLPLGTREEWHDEMLEGRL